jgi:tRNA(Ile)-lysidine synthase
MELPEQVGQNIRDRKLVKGGGKILVAVSGGLDSMTLLHLLHALSKRMGWEIVVAHFNHQLRERASDADERLVRKTAKRMKLPVITERGNVRAFAAKSKLSVEMAARKLRHEFLARAARRCKIRTVAMAHHGDDQVELFFLRLLRGAGVESMAGMKWHSPSPVDPQIELVRPLLNVTKGELAAFAREHKIPFRHDATNFTLDAPRNRVRNELLPLLAGKYQPNLTRVVLRTMEIIGGESEYVGGAARQWVQGKNSPKGFAHCTPEPHFHPPRRHPLPLGGEGRGEGASLDFEVHGEVRVHREGAASSFEIHGKGGNFDTLPPAIQRRVLYLQLSGLGAVADFELVEALRKTANCFVSVGLNLSATRDETGKVSLRRERDLKFNEEKQVMKLGRAGEVVFGGGKIGWKIQSGKVFTLPPRKDGREFFDADKVGDKITLRHWQAGDRFQPAGMKSAIKLQDLFINAKVPRERRLELAVAEGAEGRIFWVEGLRIGENYKVTPETTRRLAWRWECRYS